MSFYNFLRRRPSLRDLAEEVQFEDVTEPAKKTIDKAARAKQIADEVRSKTSDLMKQSLLSALHVTAMFSAGAHWADEHPLSDFESISERNTALSKEVASMLEGANKDEEKYFMFATLSTAIFADGVYWADKNPAPTI